MRFKKEDDILPEHLPANMFVENGFNIRVESLSNFSKPVKDGADYVPTERFRELDKFTRLYKSAVVRRLIMGMDRTTVKLFNFIAYSVRSGRDYILIDRETFMTECNISSKNTYLRATKELHMKKVILPTPHVDLFLINPVVIFCGSRVRKWPDKVNVVRGKHMNDIEKEIYQ